jgi:NitT/TauT family transport system substrate-binding protein
MRRTPSRIGAFAAAVVLLMLTGPIVPRGVVAQTLPTLRVTGPNIDDFKPVYYAIRSGLFARYGINVEVLPSKSGSAGLASVAGGSADIGFTSLPAVIEAHARGLPFQAIAPAALYLSESPTTVLFVRKDSPIRSARDLNGKVIGVSSLQDMIAMATFAWIDRNGGDSRTLHPLELPNSALLAAIEEGRVDAGTLIEPFLHQGMASGKIRILGKNLDAIGKRFQLNVYVATDTYIRSHRDTVERFERALHEAILYTDAHLPETVDLVASFTHLNPDVVAHSARAIDPEYLEPENIQPVIDVAARYRLIPKAFPASEIMSDAALRPSTR